MNPTKVAAVIALVVAVVAAGCLCYYLFENVVNQKAAGSDLDCVDIRLKNGADFPCDVDNPTMQYGVSGGIALVALITSLALFGAAKPK